MLLFGVTFPLRKFAAKKRKKVRGSVLCYSTVSVFILTCALLFSGLGFGFVFFVSFWILHFANVPTLLFSTCIYIFLLFYPRLTIRSSLYIELSHNVYLLFNFTSSFLFIFLVPIISNTVTVTCISFSLLLYNFVGHLSN